MHLRCTQCSILVHLIDICYFETSSLICPGVKTTVISHLAQSLCSYTDPAGGEVLSVSLSV